MDKMKAVLFSAVVFGWLLVLTKAEFKCYNKVDMVILLDSSASVPEDVFETTKKFASDLVKRFDTSKDRAHVAVLSYSQYVHTERRFDDDPSQESILKAIDGVNYEGSFSRLDSALDILHNKIFKKKHGARSSRNDVKKVVVVVTDGFSSLGIEFTKKLAGTLKRTGVNVFSVGTSGRVYKAELDELVSKPSEAHQLTRDLTKGAFTKDEVKRFAKEICGKKE